MLDTVYLKINQLLLLVVVAFIASCATPMTPLQVNHTLPTLTKSTFLTPAQADDTAKTNKCKYLVKNREYVAPMGLTAKADLKNGAKGIDEWVKLDGGNAYVLRSYKWVSIDQNGTSQLHILFDTMLCE